MRKRTLKNLVRRLGPLRMMMGLGALVAMAPAVDAAPFADASSPLTRPHATQADITGMAQSIRDAAGGRLTARNAQAAIAEAVAAHPAATPAALAGALSGMGLAGDVLAASVYGAASAYDVPPATIISALVTHRVLNDGRNAALSLIAALRQNIQPGIVDAALAANAAYAEMLAATEPASGESAEAFAETDIYNG